MLRCLCLCLFKEKQHICSFKMGLPVSAWVQKWPQWGHHDPPDCCRHHRMSRRTAWETDASFRALTVKWIKCPAYDWYMLYFSLGTSHLGRFHRWRKTGERWVACWRINVIHLSTRMAFLQTASWEKFNSQHIIYNNVHLWIIKVHAATYCIRQCEGALVQY